MKETFFTHDKNFYRNLFSMLVIVALQNVIAYSVNMADNIMLGAYRQEALSGAAVVNQVFFIVQQATIAIGDGLIVISSQYWGQHRTEPIRRVTGLVLRYTIAAGLGLILVCTFLGDPILRIFTSDPVILPQAHAYLSIVKYTFLLFMVTQVLLAALRSVETVKIAFVNSCVSLVLNILINSTLIYGRFGFPEMGVTGAAIGTITSRTVELLIVLVYLWKKDEKLKLFREPGLREISPELKAAHPGGLADLVHLDSHADSHIGALVVRRHRGQLRGNDVLSVHEGDHRGDLIGLRRADGKIHRDRKPFAGALGCEDALGDRPGNRNRAGSDPFLHAETAAGVLCFEPDSFGPGGSADRDHEPCDGRHVLPDAGIRRHTQRKRRFEVHHEHESDQHLADRHAAFLCGCLLVEVADRGSGAVPAVRPDLQVRAGVSAV